jgi:hypothetical protein
MTVPLITDTRSTPRLLSRSLQDLFNPTGLSPFRRLPQAQQSRSKRYSTGGIGTERILNGDRITLLLGVREHSPARKNRNLPSTFAPIDLCDTCFSQSKAWERSFWHGTAEFMTKIQGVESARRREFKCSQHFLADFMP